MQKFLKWGIIILIVNLSLTGSIQAQDVSNLSPDFPVFEDGGGTIRDAFQDSQLSKLYIFAASKGDTITIELTQGEGIDLDPYLVLLSSTGKVLAADDDSGDIATAARIQAFEISENGDYLILATTVQALYNPEKQSGMLDYTLTLSGNRQPASDSDNGEFLTIPNFQPGDSHSDSLSFEQAAYYGFFEGTAGNRITVDMSSEEADTLVYLFDPFGVRIAMNDDAYDTGDAAYRSLIEDVVLPEDGMYLILATTYGFDTAYSKDAWAGGGAFTLTLQ